MLQKSLHDKRLRFLIAIIAQFGCSLGTNLLVVPMHLYSGGIMGVSQIIRTFLVTGLQLDVGNHDIAGIVYFLINVPIFLIGLRILGKFSFSLSLLCVVARSLFTSIIPIPTELLIQDRLTSCLLAGIINGFFGGIMLTCGGSGGGVEIIGLCVCKFKPNFTVGRIGLFINSVLYITCAVLFDLETAIYSMIVNFTLLFMYDRVHQQAVTMEALIFTREDAHELSGQIIEKMNRTATHWDAIGAYSDSGVHVLCVFLTKFEIDHLIQIAREFDPHVFITTQEHLHVYGNFPRKLD